MALAQIHLPPLVSTVNALLKTPFSFKPPSPKDPILKASFCNKPPSALSPLLPPPQLLSLKYQSNDLYHAFINMFQPVFLKNLVYFSPEVHDTHAIFVPISQRSIIIFAEN